MRTYLIALVTLVSFSAGCADSKPAGVLLAKVAALEKQVSVLNTEAQELRSSLKQLKTQTALDRFSRTAQEAAQLTPGMAGYSVIQTDLGRLTVRLANVQPYASGSRVTLQIGNLLSATINGAKAQLEWGSVDDQGVPDLDKSKSREINFVETLRAGAWTNVQFVLEGIPPNDLGYVRVTDLTHSGIALLR